MTEQELQAIRRRADAATPGPWLADHDGPAVVTNSPTNTDFPQVWEGASSEKTTPSTEDLEFIAHAREDIPALLAEIDRLRARRRPSRRLVA